jgi:hypothetical protein
VNLTTLQVDTRILAIVVALLAAACKPAAPSLKRVGNEGHGSG